MVVTVSSPPPTRTTFGPKKWGKSEKNVCMGGGGGGLKEFLPWISAWGRGRLTLFLVKKRLK